MFQGLNLKKLTSTLLLVFHWKQVFPKIRKNKRAYNSLPAINRPKAKAKSKVGDDRLSFTKKNYIAYIMHFGNLVNISFCLQFNQAVFNR